MKGIGRHLLGAAAIALALAPASARAEFPFEPQSGPDAYSGYKLPPAAAVPNDLTDKRVWMYASTADPTNVLANNDPHELGGVRGAWVVDANRTAPQAWHTTTGRPDVTIAVLDSGIKWNDLGAMRDIRLKTRISRGELPAPNAGRSVPLEPGADCAAYAATGPGDSRDLNNDGVVNILDYACDTRVQASPVNGDGPIDNGVAVLDPQDVLIAFSDGDDDDDNGYVDDIVGWDFLDDDNDPFDDVQYGHGTGEARDSAGEADNGGDLGTCPNCLEIHLRVGTSFVADVNRFALATIYATDNDVEVVQEALGTLNKSRVGADAVRYAYEHGTTVIASAADEAAQHHNWPSSYPYAIVVNSVTHDDTFDAAPGLPRSYLQFNGCTNFSSRITLAIPSVSCSSDATGRGAGMAGLVYSAAYNAGLPGHPSCRRTDGSACVITPNEVRQLMASGTVNGTTQADDVDFSDAELPCSPLTDCTDPFVSAPPSRTTPYAGTSYPARGGHDQFYGYGRVNMFRAVSVLPAVPPEVEVTSPEWYEQIDATKASFTVHGEVYARGAAFSCKVYVAAGSYPGEEGAADDFVEVPSPAKCDGTARTLPLDGELAQISVADLKALFPASSGDFRGRETGVPPEQAAGFPPAAGSGRPAREPYGFVVKVVATAGQTTGQDRRQAYLHRDADMLDGWPKHLPGDVEGSPVLADIDGDNRNELVLANSDGLVHVFERDGSQVEGFPAKGVPLPLRAGSRALESGEVKEAYGAFLTTPAVGDLDHDGTPEIVVADLEGNVLVFDTTGRRIRIIKAREAFNGRPLTPFLEPRRGERNRTQPGFIASPVLADMDQNDGGRLEIVAAAMDRHVYVFNDDGTDVPGFPVLVVDRDKVASVDPATHQVTFRGDIGDSMMQGAIIDTPAVGDLTGDGKPEIVVGTNESYPEELNAAGQSQALYGALGTQLEFANGRLYAIRNGGDPDGELMSGDAPWLPGWPFKVGILQAGVLPLVGEGITGAPVIGEVACRQSAAAPRVGVIPAAGVPYIVNADGQSCYGRESGKDVGLPTEGSGAPDQPLLPAFGHPLFAPLGGQMSFLAPAAGIKRALDVVFPEYQGGSDYIAAWNTQSGQFAPGWPQEVNDLQFLTGPSVAEIDGTPGGEEVVGATAHHDLQGLTSAGADVAGFPKLTGDWTVANPALGSFGTLDTEASARRVIVAGTRNGRLMAIGTAAGPCTAAAWPKFHHDNANSGDARRDALAPGRPMSTALIGATLTFKSPGDDLLCGTPKAYEVRTSDSPITGAGWESADAVPGTFTPVAAGADASLALQGAFKRYVAVRAVDEQGNVGRPALVDRGENAGPGPNVPGGGAVPGAPKPPAQPGGTQRATCLSRTARLTRSGAGVFRLGRSATAIVARAGRPSRIRAGALRWCVTGGGSLTVSFTPKGRARLVVTTAPRHRYGKLRRGITLRTARRSYRSIRRIRRGIYRLGRTRTVFGLRNGRLRYVAIADPGLLRNTRLLRTYLNRAGV